MTLHTRFLTGPKPQGRVAVRQRRRAGRRRPRSQHNYSGRQPQHSMQSIPPATLCRSEPQLHQDSTPHWRARPI